MSCTKNLKKYELSILFLREQQKIMFIISYRDLLQTRQEIINSENSDFKNDLPR